MKKILLPTLLILLLCGCGVLHRTAYVVVEPHDEDDTLSVDSDAITVSSYLSLKNAILNFVEDGTKNGVIRAESYQGDLAEDLSQAVYEVTKLSPLGAFAVEHMTYDYSRIVSYYEVNINITFSRSQEEIQSITYVNDMDGVRRSIQEAMATYAPQLLLRVGSYESTDLEGEIDSIYETHPEFALEYPDVEISLYPESGTQRILEVKFDYRDSTEDLQAYQEALWQKLDEISKVYGNNNSELTTAKRFYSRLGRDTLLVPDNQTVMPLTNSAYGLLVEGYATSYGFAQTYLLLLDSCGISGQLVTGLKDGATHSWCLVSLDGEYYYVDPSQAVQEGSDDSFLMGTQELEDGGYFLWNATELPEVDLPDYLRPVS